MTTQYIIMFISVMNTVFRHLSNVNYSKYDECTYKIMVWIHLNAQALMEAVISAHLDSSVHLGICLETILEYYVGLTFK